MVCIRCKMVVKEEFEKIGLPVLTLDLGQVEVLGQVDDEQYQCLRANLLSLGFELLDDVKSILIERIKNVIIDMIHFSREVPKMNYSEYISGKLNYDYTYLSNVFSANRGITIRQFIIINKIEKVKELLFYDELNLTEISYRMHYSSVAHLSNQFRKVTGLTPSAYKQLKEKNRNTLEEIGKLRGIHQN